MLKPLRNYLETKLKLIREGLDPQKAEDRATSLLIYQLSSSPRQIKSRPGICTLCQYSDQESLNTKILTMSCREAARVYGIGKSSVDRHRKHIS